MRPRPEEDAQHARSAMSGVTRPDRDAVPVIEAGDNAYTWAMNGRIAQQVLTFE